MGRQRTSCGAAAASSSAVLMLRNASASSSKATSTTASVAYHASILRPPASRNAARCGSTSRAHEAEHRVRLVEGLRDGELGVCLASSPAAEPLDEVGRQERRIARNGDDIRVRRARQPRMQARERPREPADGVRHDRHAERGIALEVLVGVDQHVADLRRAGARARARPSAGPRARPIPCRRRPCAGPGRRRARCR